MAALQADIAMAPPNNNAGLVQSIDGALTAPIPVVPLALPIANAFAHAPGQLSSFGLTCLKLSLPEHFYKVAEPKVKSFATLLCVLENHKTRLASLKSHLADSTFPDKIMKAVKMPKTIIAGLDQDVSLDPLRLELLKKQIQDAISRIDTKNAELIAETDKIRNALLQLVESHGNFGLPAATVAQARDHLADLDRFRKTDYFHQFFKDIAITYTEFRTRERAAADKKALAAAEKMEKARREELVKKSNVTVEQVEKMLRDMSHTKSKKSGSGRNRKDSTKSKSKPKNALSGSKKSPGRRTSQNVGSSKGKKKRAAKQD